MKEKELTNPITGELKIFTNRTEWANEVQRQKAEVNRLCMDNLNSAIKELEQPDKIRKWKKLRNCQAKVCETESYFILRSYETIVAVIEKDSDTLYDVLRIVYKYTNSSAGQIAKFSHDYGKDKWGAKHHFTARQ